jgi:hypothetical protein
MAFPTDPTDHPDSPIKIADDSNNPAEEEEEEESTMEMGREGEDEMEQDEDKELTTEMGREGEEEMETPLNRKKHRSHYGLEASPASTNRAAVPAVSQSRQKLPVPSASKTGQTPVPSASSS